MTCTDELYGYCQTRKWSYMIMTDEKGEHLVLIDRLKIGYWGGLNGQS